MNTLALENLSISFGSRYIIRDFSYCFTKGLSYAIAGESGAGKSTLLKSIVRLLPSSLETDGAILIDKASLPDESRMHTVRGKRILYLMQDPLVSFNPVYTIEKQIARCIRLKDKSIRKSDRDKMIDEAILWAGLKIEDKKLYPHEMSGGMLQRASLSLAYVLRPRVLLLDEPTASLDGQLEHMMLQRLSELSKENDSILIFITHSLKNAYAYSDVLLIMNDGVLAESGCTKDVIENPKSEYGRALVSASSLNGVSHD